MTLELIAPAKLNLVLEITGRRPDGYHEIASVMQTIDLADHISLEAAPSLELELMGELLRGVPAEGPRNLAFAAARALAAAAGRIDLGARIRLEKRIPAGMGLGGGSSDAAAVLRGLNRLWGLGLGPDALAAVAASVGSDVAFFLHGGTALATGRGEVVEPLPDLPPLELTLFVSGADLEDKTRRMYSLIAPGDYTDGRKAEVAAECARRSLSLSETDLYNAFDRHVGQAVPPLGGAMRFCREAGLAVLAAGSGPGFFTPTPLSLLAPLLLRELESGWGVTPVACRTLSRANSVVAEES